MRRGKGWGTAAEAVVATLQRAYGPMPSSLTCYYVRSLSTMAPVKLARGIVGAMNESPAKRPPVAMIRRHALAPAALPEGKAFVVAALTRVVTAWNSRLVPAAPKKAHCA